MRKATGIDDAPRIVVRDLPSRASPSARLTLLNGFELAFDGRPVTLPVTVQRLVAFLALEDRPVPRGYVAGTLWVDASEEHARGSLRSALWRLRRTGYQLISTTPTHLWIAPEVAVDVKEMESWAHRLDRKEPGPEGDLELTRGLSGELLPGWYDEWVVIERERLRQLRLHALERLCERLSALGRFGAAVEAGLAAVASEPLRESAHRVLLQAHLAEGNRGEAIRHYEQYRQMLRDELDLDPSPVLERLVKGRVTARSI